MSDSVGNPKAQAPLWQRLHITQDVFFLIVAGAVGFLCGICAWLMKLAIKRITLGLDSMVEMSGFNWPLLIYPLAGIMLTGIICRYVFGYSPAHGTAKLIRRLKGNDLDMQPSMMISSMITSAVTLGFGGSAGGEGPIALTGAAVGSNISRKLGLSPQQLRMIVGCGAAAGISAIFKSPIGGALYALEVLRMEFTATAIMGLLVAVIIASLTAYTLSGFTFDISMDQSIPFTPDWLPWLTVLGVFCGIYALYYKFFMNLLGSRLSGIKNAWIKNVVGGSILAVSVALCPSLYGEGYDIIGPVINGDFHDILHYSIWEGYLGIDTLILVSGLTLALKTFACAATNYGGGVAGAFAPTLFAGCMAGLFFALAINSAFGADVKVAHFAFFGMAGAMAGIIRAPLMAIFLVCEMSGTFGYFMPVAWCVAVSTATVRLFTFNNYFIDKIDRFNGAVSMLWRKLLRIFHRD